MQVDLTSRYQLARSGLGVGQIDHRQLAQEVSRQLTVAVDLPVDSTVSCEELVATETAAESVHTWIRVSRLGNDGCPESP